MTNGPENYGFNRLSKPPKMATKATQKQWQQYHGPYTRMNLTPYAVIEEEKEKDPRGLTTIIVSKDETQLPDKRNGIALYISPCSGHSVLYYRGQYWAVMGVLTRKKGKILKLLAQGGKFQDGPLRGEWLGLPKESIQLLDGFLRHKLSWISS